MDQVPGNIYIGKGGAEVQAIIKHRIPIAAVKQQCGSSKKNYPGVNKTGLNSAGFSV